MKLSVIRWLASCCLVLVMSFVVFAQKKEMRDAASQSQKSARVFREIMGAPDKAIPKDILDNATCVAVFPQVIKAGFIVGGRGGRGVASCRTKTGWSGPIFLNMGGGSFGLQIGAQATDFILLFMNEGGMNKLLSDNFEIGGDATAAAGPVGRQAGASTNIRLDAQILSYSRSKGLFAGLELKGVVIKKDSDDNDAVYGAGVKSADVLRGAKAAPESVKAFPTTLTRYSARKG
jgi:SH3 domain-containing YSC84-like protein 1